MVNCSSCFPDNDSQCEKLDLPGAVSPASRSHSNALKSPRQKTRHRHSPLKANQGTSRSFRHSTPPSKPYLSKLAAAVEARETMPLSPNDPRYPRDLRRAALLRSVAQRLEARIPSFSFLYPIQMPLRQMAKTCGEQLMTGPFLFKKA